MYIVYYKKIIMYIFWDIKITAADDAFVPQIGPSKYWILSSEIQFKTKNKSRVFFIGAIIRFTHLHP
jgi:hypothetical protein